jgi:non-heme chloroperoxidase
MSKTVTTKDGTELYVKDWGSGPVLFFVNGTGITTELFQYQHMYFLRKGFRIVTYDRRGHGKSEQPGGGYDADTLADDMAAVIAAKGLKDMTIVAHSFGCAEVARYLTRHGEGRVKRIILIGGTTPFVRKTLTNPEGVEGSLIDGLRAGWTKDYPRWVDDSVRPFFVPETSQAMIDWAVPLLYETPIMVATAINETATETDFRQDVERITVPTLIVHGDRDASCPLELTGKRTAKLVKHARLEVYEGAPHGLMLTHMDRLHADIESFIRET